MEQNAFDLMWLSLFVLGALVLPIAFGLVAVLRERD